MIGPKEAALRNFLSGLSLMVQDLDLAAREARTIRVVDVMENLCAILEKPDVAPLAVDTSVESWKRAMQVAGLFRMPTDEELRLGLSNSYRYETTQPTPSHDLLGALPPGQTQYFRVENEDADFTGRSWGVAVFAEGAVQRLFTVGIGMDKAVAAWIAECIRFVRREPPLT